MHVPLKVYKAPQNAMHYGGQAWPSINPPPDARLHEHPEDFRIVNPLRILGSPEQRVLCSLC